MMIWTIAVLGCLAAVFGGAPDDVKPAIPSLKVVQITPSYGVLNDPNQVYNLEGSAAITVVFNRAVIALGSDWGKELTGALSPFEFTGLRTAVPGKLRWVTTSIARFDPTGDWPTDLNFSVSVKNITTFDGSVLDKAVSAFFATKKVSMRVRGVTSALAASLTGNQWSAQRGYWQASMGESSSDVEVPSDGVVTIDFAQGDLDYCIYAWAGCADGKIDAELVANALVFRKSGSTARIDVRSTVKACKYGGDHCISFVPPALESDVQYELVLPKGSVYSSVAGVTQKDFTITLWGPFAFDLPFLPLPQLTYLASRRWSLYLRHGLASNIACDASSCAALAAQLTLTDEKSAAVPFELTRTSPSTLELYVATASPLHTYQLRVAASASVTDGFGLPLRNGSVTLPMAEAAQLMAYNGADVFEKAFDANITFVHRMQGALLPIPKYSGYCRSTVTRVVGFNVDASNIVDVVSSLRSSSLYSRVGGVSQDLSDSTDGTARATALPTAALWGKSQTFLMQQVGFNDRCVANALLGNELVSRADLSLTLLGSLAQVTRPSDNSLVANANITVYRLPYYNGVQSTAYFVGSVKTDANGLADVVLNESNYNYGDVVVTVQSGDEFLVLRNAPLYNAYKPDYASLRAAVTTDRNLYKEGDVVSVKGYIRQFNSMAVGSLPNSVDRVYGAIQWLRDDVKSYEIVEATLSEFGAYVATFHVPPSVSYGVNTAQFWSAKPVLQSQNGYTYWQFSGDSVGTVAVNVADPRIPTGVLEIKAVEAVYKPKTKAGIQLKLSTQTYTGAPLPKSEVTVAWSIVAAPSVYDGGFYGGFGLFYDYVAPVFFGGRGKPLPDSTPALPKGERVFTTDESGLLTTPLVLSDADLAGTELKDGQSLKLEARMIGATRELLTDSLTLPVRASPWQVRVKPSSDNLVPGLSFGVSVDVVDEHDSSVRDIKVAIELAEATDAEANALGSLIDDATGALRPFANRGTAQTCTATSDGGGALQCTKLLLKATKKFLLRASATAPDGSVAESALPLGKTAAEWTASPVAALPTPVLLADKQAYRSGDVVTISFMNPFAGSSRLLVRWGNAFAARQAQFLFKSEGETKFSLPALGAECRTGCLLVAALQAGHDAARSLAGAPISNLFDIKGAQALGAQISIDVTDKSLLLGEVRVSSDAPDSVTAPRKRVEFTVDVAGADGKPIANGEVHLFVVDRKVLDLAPHAVLRAADSFQVEAGTYFAVYQSQASVASLELHQRTLVRLVRRAALAPWGSLSWNGDADSTDEAIQRGWSRAITYSSSGGCSNCDTASEPRPDAGFPPGQQPYTTTWATSQYAATIQPSRGGAEAGGGFANDAASPPKNAASGAPPAGGPSTKAPELRTEPVWTPLSATARVKDGKATFVLEKMPDNLGTFRVAALATDGAAFGSGEMSLVSRLEYNVEPSLPRIARVGDRFVAGATVSSNFDKARYPITLYMAVSVTCDYIGLLDEVPSKPVVLTAPGPVRVEFGFEAFGLTPEGADAPFYFTLVDKDLTQLDRLVARVPVLPQQSAVLAATSFALLASPTGEGRNEGLQIPEHVDHSATVTVTAGVGRLPAILAYADQLLDASESADPSGLDYVAALVPSWLLSGSFAPAVSAPLALRINGAFTRATSQLKRLTLSVGLVYYRPTWYIPTWVDVSLNAFAFWATAKLTSSEQALLPRDQWRNAINVGLDEQARLVRQFGGEQFSDFDLLVEVFFALGFDHTVPSQYAADFAPARLFANVGKLSSRGEALLAAALIERKSTLASDQSALLAALLLKLNNKIRVQGRTAYIAWSPSSKYADLSASIDGLLALSSQPGANPSDVLTEKVANWIAAPATEIWYSVGGMQAARSAYALARYDVTRGNDKPDFTLRAAAGSFELLTTGQRAGVTFSSVGQAPVQASTNAWFLPPVGPGAAKDKLEFYAKGTSGEASVVVALDFVPCDRDRSKGPQCRVSTTPVYRGIDVQKVIRLFDASSGASLPSAGITSAQSGQQVEVTIQLSTPDDLTNVRVVDWLPAGLEALEADEPSSGVGASSWFYGWWVWASFPVKEVRKDRVEAFAYALSAGTHTLTYTALVVTPGRFSLPPAKAFVVGQPELLGLSAGGVWGSADPAWNSVIAGRQAGVCSFDPIKVLIDGATKELPAANPGDRPTPTPTLPPKSAAATTTLSSLCVAIVALLVCVFEY